MIKNPKLPNMRVSDFGIRNSDLSSFVSDFELRISDFSLEVFRRMLNSRRKICASSENF